MAERTGVLVLTLQRRDGDAWPVRAELRESGGLPTQRDGQLRLDLADLDPRPDPHGRRLGEALFTGPIGELWARARARCPDRLHLALRVDDPDLRALRWEALQGPVDGGWARLRLDQRVPLSLEIPSETDRTFAPLPADALRALILVTSPTDLADYGMTHFDTLAALQCAREALHPIPCDVLAFGIPDAAGPPTLESLCARLTERAYAILHIVCHGAYTRGRNETLLYLADDDETTQPVPADKLLRRLGRLGGEVGLPHLAFLCACESAAPEAERALGGLGQRLVRELGLPAVVAMTDRISVDTATSLIGPFYRQLARHGLVDLALAEASTQIAERRDIAAALALVRAAGESLVDATGLKEQGVIAAAPPPPSPLYAATWLPLSLGDRFVGRDADLAALADHLLPDGPARVDAAVLVGQAGFGKTRLALEFMWKHRARFSGGIFWISGAAAERRDATLHHILTLLDPAAPPLEVMRARGEDPGPRLAAAVRALQPGQPKLWVVEDIPEPAPGAPPFALQAWCPAWGEVDVLAISRARLPDAALRHVELGPLAVDAGVALLAAAAADPLPPDLARALVEWVGGLPLALELIARSLALGDLGPEELRDLVARGSVARALGEAEAVVDQAGGGSFGLLSALRASYESLTPEAQRLARLLATLGPEPLPTALVKAFGDDAPRPARAALVARSFVTGLSGHVFGTMHRVLADFLRAAATPDEAARARDVLLTGLPADALDEPQRWPDMNAWAVHADALLARLAGDEPDIDLALLVVRLYLCQDRLAEALRLARCACALADRRLPAEHPTTLVTRLLLAAALHDSGDHLQALAIREDVLVRLRRHHSEQSFLTQSAQEALAHSLRMLGQRRRSIEIFSALVARRRRELGPDTESTIVAEFGLAMTLLADEDFRGALAVLEPLRPRLLRLDGPDSIHNIHAAAVRASALFGLGRLDEALAELEEALPTANRTLGPDHSTTLDLVDGLVHVFRARGELARALELALDSLARHARRFGEEHPLTLLVTHHVARLEGALGDRKAARARARRAADTAVTHLGERHLVSIALRLEAGIAALELGDLAAARVDLLIAADATEATAGPDHPGTIRARAALAQLSILSGDAAAARDALTGLLATTADRLGEDHPEALTLRNNLGLALISLGDAVAAADLFKDLVARSERVLGEAHPETLQRTMLLSRARLDAGDPAGALAIATANLAALVAHRGDDHPDAHSQRVILSGALRALGRPGEAEPPARIALAGLRARLPADHVAVRDAILSLGLCLSDQDRLDEAYPLLAEAEQLFARQTGGDEAAAASLGFDLSAIELRRGDAEAAARRLTASLPLFARVWGPDAFYTLLAAHNLALADARRGRLQDAITRLRDLVPRAQAALGDHPSVAGFAQNLATLEARAAAKP